MRWLSAQGTRLSQPQSAARVDWSNPLTRGLKFVGLGARGGLSLVTAGPQSLAAASSRAGRSGVGAYVPSPGGTTPICQTGATGVTGSDYSLFAFGTLPSASTVRAAIDDDLDTSSPRCFQFRIHAGKVELITFNTGGTPYFATGAALTAAQLAGGVAMAAVVAGNQIASFTNGHKTSATASGTQRTPTGNFYVGQHKGTGANGWDGELVLVAAWSRALSDAEVASLSANPWQLFEPERRIWVPVSASGGGSSTSLVIQSALHAHAADGPTLTTDSTLAVSDALHAHSADALTLGTDLLLAVDDASHAHAAEALTLDIGTALLVADATHAHAADGLALTTDSFLAVADALHGHTAENLALTADGAVDLVIQDALHAHTADELMLSATGAGGYDDDPKRAPRKREKLTVIHKDDSDERSQEFEALLARVKGQALDKAKSAAQAAPVATPPADIKPPRMPEIRGVEASLLRQWMPDLLSTYRATFTAELQALASAQQAAAQAQMRALQRQQYEDEEIAILAMLA